MVKRPAKASFFSLAGTPPTVRLCGTLLVSTVRSKAVRETTMYMEVNQSCQMQLIPSD